MASDETPLPVDASGNPDWAYMDAYMHSTMNETEAALSAMQTLA